MGEELVPEWTVDCGISDPEVSGVDGVVNDNGGVDGSDRVDGGDGGDRVDGNGGVDGGG